tara:strand:+ start:85 stop:297 length:213 start_codon:yes stop_codon:yes gene_type:complete
MNEIVEEVIAAYGGVSGVQDRFGYKHPMAVYNWRSRGIPKSLLADIHIDTGIEISRLRLGVPDPEVQPAA